MKSGYLLHHTFGLAALLALSSQVIANDNVITVKGGTFSLESTNQTIDVFPSTINATFEDDTSTFGIEYDHVFESGASIGGGFQAFSADYTSTTGDGSVDASFFTFNGKYYFNNDGDFKPFIGGTAGIGLTDFSGAVSGNSIGFALGAMVGFRYQFSLVGIYAEYKNYLSANTEDDLDAEVDIAGESLTAGLSFQF